MTISEWFGIKQQTDYFRAANYFAAQPGDDEECHGHVVLTLMRFFDYTRNTESFSVIAMAFISAVLTFIVRFGKIFRPFKNATMLKGTFVSIFLVMLIINLIHPFFVITTQFFAFHTLACFVLINTPFHFGFYTELPDIFLPCFGAYLVIRFSILFLWRAWTNHKYSQNWNENFYKFTSDDYAEHDESEKKTEYKKHEYRAFDDSNRRNNFNNEDSENYHKIDGPIWFKSYLNRILDRDLYNAALLFEGHVGSEEEIKKRYRELAKKYHPDNQETGDAELFKRINLINDDFKTAFSH